MSRKRNKRSLPAPPNRVPDEWAALRGLRPERQFSQRPFGKEAATLRSRNRHKHYSSKRLGNLFNEAFAIARRRQYNGSMPVFKLLVNPSASLLPLLGKQYPHRKGDHRMQWRRNNLNTRQLDEFEDKIARWASLSFDERQEVISDALFAFAQSKEVIVDPVRWLLRAARNCKLHRNKVRCRDNKRLIVRDPARIEMVSNPASTQIPMRRSISTTLSYAIRDALKLLPAKQRDMVTLCDIQGVAPREAAMLLGERLSTAKSSLRRGRMQLRMNHTLIALSNSNAN